MPVKYTPNTSPGKPYYNPRARFWQKPTSAAQGSAPGKVIRPSAPTTPPNMTEEQWRQAIASGNYGGVSPMRPGSWANFWAQANAAAYQARQPASLVGGVGGKPGDYGRYGATPMGYLPSRVPTPKSSYVPQTVQFPWLPQQAWMTEEQWSGIPPNYVPPTLPGVGGGGGWGGYGGGGGGGISLPALPPIPDINKFLYGLISWRY